MTVVNGLPAHALLVHFLVVLAPLTALLDIVCGLNIIVAIMVLAVGLSAMIQIYRVGDAGAQSVWDGEIAHLNKANGT